MNKKIMLLALGAVSVVMLAVPAMASAITPLHLSSAPAGAQPIDSLEEARLSTTGTSLTVKCAAVGGNATFTSTTGGNLTLSFTGCTTSLGGRCENDNEATGTTINTTTLPFDLATVENNAGGVGNGVLVTPNNGHFATFKCHVLGITTTYVVGGNGVIGTITQPGCNSKSKDATIKFEIESHGVQKHKKLVGTSTEYSLEKGTEKAAQSGAGTITFSNEPELVCT